MRVFDLISMASEYLKMGIAVAIFVMFCFFTGYFIVYRKLLKGQKKIIWTRFLWWGVFICYLCVVLGATLFSRAGWTDGSMKPLFYSYKDAWIHFSNAAWRNIILNFCMFIPFGFWLPLGQKRLRRFWSVSLAGFGVSLLIECTQLFLQRGIFELDDIWGNTVGAMIGYGLFSIGMLLISRKGRTRRRVVFTMLLQAPLLLTVAGFLLIFYRYSKQEIGNNPYSYIEAYDSTKIHVTGEIPLSAEETFLDVYEVATLTVEAAKEKGEQIFKTLGTTADVSRTDVYDETVVMYSEKGSYHLWIDYQGGTLSLTDFDVLYPESHATSEPVSGAGEDTIRNALGALGFAIPKEAQFSESEAGKYRFDVSMAKTEDGIINGVLTCSYYGAEKGIGEVSDHLITGAPYKSYKAISEQEALEKIKNGEFSYRGEASLEIQVLSCSLAYALDSKGYYQPNYQFECILNGEKSQILIPALKKERF